MNDSSLNGYESLSDIREHTYGVINGEVFDVLTQIIPERLIGLRHDENPEVHPFPAVKYRETVWNAVQVLE